MLSLILSSLHTWSPFFFLSYYSSLTWNKFPRGIGAIGESQKIIGFSQLMSYFICYTADNPSDLSSACSWPSELWRNTHPPRLVFSSNAVFVETMMPKTKTKISFLFPHSLGSPVSFIGQPTHEKLKKTLKYGEYLMIA